MLTFLMNPFCKLIIPCIKCLQASPCIRFNKEGILLAVSTNENCIKILANQEGIRLLRTMENRSFDASRVASAAVVKVNKFLNLKDLLQNMLLKCVFDIQAPAIGTFPPANPAVGTSIGDRAAPVAAMVGMVGVDISFMGFLDL